MRMREISDDTAEVLFKKWIEKARAQGYEDPLFDAWRRLKELRALVNKLNVLHKAVEDEFASHNMRLNKLKSDIEKIQAKCDHPITKKECDPSGGSDSSRECEICGRDGL